MTPSCDLLSFQYLCSIGNSIAEFLCERMGVVICFHFSIFVPLGTACLICLPVEVCCDLLSFQYLCSIGNSRVWRQTFRSGSCDLLSFQYLCSIGNSRYQSGETLITVVICFHFSIFVPLGTAEYQYQFSIQRITTKFRNKKEDIPKQEIPPIKRDFLFKITQVVAQEY